MTSLAQSPPWSQLSPHRAERVNLPGRYGPIAALHVQAHSVFDPHPVAVLVPGFTGSKEDFAPLLDPIAEIGVDAIAIDLPGQYESGGPNDESAYLPSALGLVVAELVGKLASEGSPVLLMGHSYGGLVARAAVLAGAPVVGLTLLGSGPAELPQGWRRQALDMGEPAMRQFGLQAAQKLRETLDAHNPAVASQPEELKAFLRERFLRSLPSALLGMAHGLRTETGQRDMADRLDADFAVITGSAHSPNTENPEFLLDILVPTWRTWLLYS